MLDALIHRGMRLIGKDDAVESTVVTGEAVRFAIVGIGGVVVDLGIFNLATHFNVEPLSAKALSTTVAALLSYFANRHWAFAHRAHRGAHRELPMFILLSAIGLGIAEGCLAISHYGLGYHSTLANNVSANGIGLVLGTIWRFWSFKKWVFQGHALPADEILAAAAV